MDENNMTSMVSDLPQRIKPTSPQLLAMYVKAIKSQHSFREKILVQNLVDIILLPSKESLQTIRHGLELLIKHLLKSPNEHAKCVELMRSFIEKVICAATSLFHISCNGHDDDDDDDDQLTLHQSLQKIELLKVELVIMEVVGGDTSISQKSSNPFTRVEISANFSQKSKGCELRKVGTDIQTH